MSHRFSSIAAMVEPEPLAAALGPIVGVEREPLAGVGFSGATHERLRVRLEDGSSRALVLKRIDLASDFTSVRTRDTRGREVVMAASPRAAVWRVFRSPYLGWARDGSRVAVLMDDLTDRLLPDERKPIQRWQEDTLLATLARMHATYWGRPPARWTAQPWDLERLLVEANNDVPALPEILLAQHVRHGWTVVAARLPRRVMDALHAPTSRLREEVAGLPRTLVHGDAKVANFALRSGEVWAFDWACAAAGPPSLDLGWYLAVNASRLTRPKEAVAARYRMLLEEQRGAALDDDVWRRLWAHAIRCGSRSLLWSKAAACERGVAGAEVEWEWWASRLPEALAVQTRPAR